MRLRRLAASAALLAAMIAVAVGVTSASAAPQQIACPPGSPEGSFCAQYGPGDEASVFPGGEQIDCPASAPPGSTCYRYTDGPGGSGPPSDGSGAGSCSTKDGPVELIAVKANGEDVLDQLCPQVMYQESSGPPGGPPSGPRAAGAGGGMPQGVVLLQTKDGGPFGADVSSVIPQGTPVEMTVKMGPDPKPIITIGTLNVSNGSVTIGDDGTTKAKGKAAKVNFAFLPGQCPGQEMVFVGIAMLGEPDDASQFPELDKYKGLWAFGNMQGIGFGGTGQDGGEPSVTVDGCNLDDNPETLDGFLTMFLPTSGVAGPMEGLDPPALAAISKLPPAKEEQALELSNQIEDNGQKVKPANTEYDTELLPPDISRASGKNIFKVAAGILVDVTFSYSQHEFSASANRKNSSFANRCVRSKKKKLKVVRRAGKSVLACAKKKRKR